MLPSYFEYYNPVKIISGHKSLENVPYELNLLGSNSPLIITDQGIVKAGLLQLLLDILAAEKIEIKAVYTETPPDSSNRVVNKVAKMYTANNCDSIIALGGGSVLDTAKGVNIVVTEKTDDLMKFVGAERLKNKMQPFIAIPTTSGTGSEVTLVAVIANEEKNCKMAFTSYMLFPDVAVLDPRMTITVPPHITAATGMDALTHAVEAYSCLQKNPLSDAYAVTAINLISKYLIPVVKKGGDENLRLALANASLLAGCAFSNSMVGIVHGIGHACGGVANIPHGNAMAILLPHGMEYNFNKNEKYYAELLLPLAGPEEYSKTPSQDRAKKAIQKIRDLNGELNKLTGMPTTLSAAGVKMEQLPKIAETALNDGALIFNPEVFA
ncbi:MAG: iron-containing alcohol dehydrogenase [Syntrophomonadaceae bacterium]|nr:iron-containing alcohol dehydrogenase [Syntrophomonadaceae bacterium]